MRQWMRVWAGLGSAWLLASAPVHADLQISSPSLETVACEACDVQTQSSVSTPSFVTSDTATSTNGAFSAETYYNFGISGFNGSLRFEMLHDMGGDDPLGRASSTGVLTLTPVGAPVTYSLSGIYGYGGETDGNISLSVSLVDADTSAVLFENVQVSDEVNGEDLTLGQTTGNVSNTLSGSLSGMLLAGHNYVLTYSYTLTQAGGFGLGGAGGELLMELAPIPAPGSACLGFMGLVGLIRRRHR
jgi:hypothetical protein